MSPESINLLIIQCDLPFRKRLSEALGEIDRFLDDHQIDPRARRTSGGDET